jgi:predicted nucleotidyltransferase
MKLICKTRFGSHLYGTATPTSDIDIRGVFIPSKRDILLGRIPKTNKEQEVGQQDDYELYSLHHFVKLACEGQTVAFDMLWTPASLTSKGEAGYVWDELVGLRHKFLSKRMNAFVGYARTQAAKYSLKGERLNRLKSFLEMIEPAGDDTELVDAECPPRFIHLMEDVRQNPQGLTEYQICGKWFASNTRIKYIRSSLERVVAGYGQRAANAAGDGGVDWKAMSHAVRVSLELHELLNTREIKFPLTYAETLLKIKRGEMDIVKVQDYLDEILASVEELTEKSSLPETVSRDFWDEWIMDTLEREWSEYRFWSIH